MKLVSFAKETLTDATRIITTKEGLKKLYRVPLYRNAVYLMLNSGAVNVTGFFFWLLAARLYSTEAVGLTSAAISAIALLTLVSTIGLDYALIRFLPGSGDQARSMINSSFTLTGAISIALAFIFLAGLKVWSPALLFIREHPVFFTVFIVTTAATTLRLFANRTLIARRRAGFSLGQGLIFGLVRFVPLVILAGSFQAFGIFTSWGIAISLTAVVSILFFIPRIETGYRPFPVIRKRIITDVMHFSLTNYITNIFSAITPYVLPLMVVNILGAESNAYFYIGWAISGTLFMIPVMTSFSLFAEGSHNEERLGREIRRSLKLILVILIPAVIMVLLLGDNILLFFGSAYSENTTRLLRILAISAFPLSINYVYFTMKRVEMDMKSVIGLNAFIAVVTMALSYILLPRIGIIGAGISWLVAQGITAVIAGRKFWKKYSFSSRPGTETMPADDLTEPPR